MGARRPGKHRVYVCACGDVDEVIAFGRNVRGVFAVIGTLSLEPGHLPDICDFCPPYLML